MDFIKHILNNLAPVSDNQWNQLKTILRPKKLEKGEHFVSIGDEPSNFAFIKNGVFKLSYQPGGSDKEFIKLFSGPNELIAPYADFLRNRPSNINIVSITPSEIYICKFEALKTLSENSSEWEIHRRKISDFHYLLKEEKEYELLTNSAEERYVKFKEKFKQYINDIPSYLIAEYLNVTPSYLSTLKRRIKE
jgi:CRP-like cAMP-binding protein